MLDNDTSPKWGEPLVRQSDGLVPWRAYLLHLATEMVAPLSASHKKADVFANLPVLQTSGSNPENLDTDFRAARPPANSGGCDRIRRERAYIRPASLLPSGQTADGPDRGRALLLPRGPRSVPMHAR